MTLLDVKIIAIILIFLTGVIGGKLALYLSGRADNRRVFSLGNSFSAGIFLGAGLIHMLPDALNNYSEIIKSDFPWVFFLCAAGFLIILGLEQIIVGHHLELNNNDSKELPNTTTYLLTIILSIHSIITGIALGTENTLTLTIIIFIAVIAHKGSAAFALTTSLCKAVATRKRIHAVIILFSLMTPLGIIIGSLMDTMLEPYLERLSEGAFDSLAAGTFLYVAIVDIINEEFSINKDIKLKVLFTAAGLGLMTILSIYL